MSRSPKKKQTQSEGRQKRNERMAKRQLWLWLALLGVLAVLVAVAAVSCGRREEAISSVPASRTRRAPLEAGAARESAYFTDRIGWLEDNRSLAEGDLRYFYEKTGIQPHIYIRNALGSRSATREEMDAYAGALYASLFNDEAHLLILADETENRDTPLLYGFAAGKKAAAVLDEEALEILAGYWAYGFADSQELGSSQKAKAAGEVLRRTADNIMRVKSRAGWAWAFGVLTALLLFMTLREYRKNWRRLQKQDRA